MSLLALLASTSSIPGPGPDPDPDPDPPGDPTDLLGPFPTVSPYNSPLAPCTIPTYDGSGETIHPGVYDFGRGNKWNGYRFWMANTPYPNNDVTLENPSIFASQDGQTWVVPAGVTNPIYDYPSPDGALWSDTDLIYDPVGNRLVLTYRDGNEKNYVATSTDGVTWPAYPGTFVFQAGVSPSLVRTPGGTWRMYYQVASSARFREADDPLGPYGAEVVCSGVNGWHAHVTYDAVLGRYLAASGSGVLPYRSVDGITFSGRSALITGQTYRPCIRRYDANTLSLWYSTGTGVGQQQWTHYTRVPDTPWR